MEGKGEGGREGGREGEREREREDFWETEAGKKVKNSNEIK